MNSLISNTENPLKQKMPLEDAKQEIIDWLVERNESNTKITNNEDIIAGLAEKITEGRLVWKTEEEIEYRLVHPLRSTSNNGQENSKHLEVLKFKQRINYKQVRPYMKGVKMDDAIGIVHAHSCALIGKPMAILELLDIRDLSVVRNITTLFL